MTDKRAEFADTEIAYAILKAGHRPFDCSRHAMRQQALAILACARVPAKDHSRDRAPAAIIDLDLERVRRDLDPPDFPR